MFELTPIEIVGYVASLLIVLSLAMSSVVRLRVISFAGSCLFLVYGFLIGSVPIITTNLAIAFINIWYLRLELGHRRDLGASPIPPDAPFLTDFLAFHLDDVRRFQPGAEIPTDPDAAAWLLTRDGLPAGVIIGHRRGATLEIVVDYVLKPYRDSRLGDWVFGAGARVFTSAGIERIETQPGDDTHRRYLNLVGFRPEGDRYVLDLSSPAR